MQFQVLRKLKYRKKFDNTIAPAANDDPTPEPYLVRTYMEESSETLIVFLDLPEYKYWGVNTSCINVNVQNHCFIPKYFVATIYTWPRNGHSNYIVTNTTIFGTFGIPSYRSFRVVMVQNYSQCTARVMSLTTAVLL